ncbi:MAG: hypothetical protein HON65_03780 [Rhodospirillales bacterium]|nr:hypothetical protein [Rhodospirillales bacterium]
MNLLQTLMRPDREEFEDSERRDIGNAANVLQIGEFQLLQLAYYEWFGKNLPRNKIDDLFHRYMMNAIVPYWAKHYAAQILRLDEAGRLDINHSNYHRYDSDYKLHKGNRVHKILMISLFLGFFILGCFAIAQHEIESVFSQFPPFLSEEEMQPTKKP